MKKKKDSKEQKKDPRRGGKKLVRACKLQRGQILVEPGLNEGRPCQITGKHLENFLLRKWKVHAKDLATGELFSFDKPVTILPTRLFWWDIINIRGDQLVLRDHNGNQRRNVKLPPNNLATEISNAWKDHGIVAVEVLSDGKGCHWVVGYGEFFHPTKQHPLLDCGSKFTVL